MALAAIQETALATTFALLRQWGACPEGYRTLAQHLGGVRAYGPRTPIPLSVVVAANGLADALWCLRAVPPEQAATRDRLARLFACDCAEHVLPYFEARYPEDQRPRACIQVARRFALGQATNEELAAAHAAADAAWATAATWASLAAGVAAHAADAAADAATWAACAAGVAAHADDDAAAADAATAATWAAGAAGAAEREWQTRRLLHRLSWS